MDMPSFECVPETVVLPPPPANRRRWGHLADKLGATASLLCAVHCVLLPFVLALLPLVGLGFLAGHVFERAFVAGAAALASASILSSWHRHRRPQALWLMVPGIALMLIGVGISLDAHTALHLACVVSGGLLVASAHLTNLALARRHGSVACACAAGYHPAR